MARVRGRRTCHFGQQEHGFGLAYPSAPRYRFLRHEPNDEFPQQQQQQCENCRWQRIWKSRRIIQR